MGEHVPVRLHELLHLAELLEEVSVLAVVDGVEVVLGVRQPVEDLLDLAPPDDLHAAARAVGGGEGGAALLAVQLHHKPSVCTGDLHHPQHQSVNENKPVLPVLDCSLTETNILSYN